MAPTIAADQWPTIREVASVSGVSTVHVLTLLHAGRLRGVKTRLGWFIEPASAHAYACERMARRQKVSA